MNSDMQQASLPILTYMQFLQLSQFLQRGQITHTYL